MYKSVCTHMYKSNACCQERAVLCAHHSHPMPSHIRMASGLHRLPSWSPCMGVFSPAPVSVCMSLFCLSSCANGLQGSLTMQTPWAGAFHAAQEGAYRPLLLHDDLYGWGPTKHWGPKYSFGVDLALSLLYVSVFGPFRISTNCKTYKQKPLSHSTRTWDV